MSVSLAPGLLEPLAPSSRATTCCRSRSPDAFVRTAANAVCQTENGALCGGEVGATGDGERTCIQGTNELRVDETTGAYEFVDTREWLEWKTAAPLLPPESLAQSLASRYPSVWPGWPQDGIFVGSDFVMQGAAIAAEEPTAQGGEIADSCFAVGIRVKFERRIDDRPVRGGGGRWSATFGANNHLQQAINTGWRPVVRGSMVSVIDPQIVVDAIRAQGWDAAIDGMKIPADELTITNLELGYYEPPMGEAIASICPCYVVTGFMGPTSDPTLSSSASGRMERCHRAASCRRLTARSSRSVRKCASKAPRRRHLALAVRVVRRGRPVLGCGRDGLYDVGPASGFRRGRGSDAHHRDGRDRCRRSPEQRLRPRDPGCDGVRGSGRGGGADGLRLAGPNPFGASTTIACARFRVRSPSRARVVVLDAGGRSIRTLVDATRQPDQYQVTWDGQDDLGHRVASGAYFVRMDVAGEHASIPVTVLRR
ncbi:MAG: FlgD immunoglobulin-like domain containing protein [Candidatus Eisenbacteria bacterium]